MFERRLSFWFIKETITFLKLFSEDQSLVIKSIIDLLDIGDIPGQPIVVLSEMLLEIRGLRVALAAHWTEMNLGLILLPFMKSLNSA